MIDDMDLDSFNRSPVYNLNLSRLKALYEKQDVSAVNLLHQRHKIHIDDHFRLKVGAGQLCMDTTKSKLDYHLTVANCIGLSPILPNAASNHQFSFKMNLKKYEKVFKHKHAMLGFDPAGRMLYLGTRKNEDIYLAMVPNDFLTGHVTPPSPGYSSGSPCMTKRHYRLIVLMILHFLERISDLPYVNDFPVHSQDLEAADATFNSISNALYVSQILQLFRTADNLQFYPRILSWTFNFWINLFKAADKFRFYPRYLNI